MSYKYRIQCMECMNIIKYNKKDIKKRIAIHKGALDRLYVHVGDESPNSIFSAFYYKIYNIFEAENDIFFPSIDCICGHIIFFGLNNKSNRDLCRLKGMRYIGIKKIREMITRGCD